MATFSRKVLLFGSALFAMCESPARAEWIYKNDSRVIVTGTATVPAPTQGFISSNSNGSSPVNNSAPGQQGSRLPSSLQTNMKGWAKATDNEAFFSETGQTANACMAFDAWDWHPLAGEPAMGEIEEQTQVRGYGWIDLVNGEAAGSLVLAMRYENSLGCTGFAVANLAVSTESRTAFELPVEIEIPLGAGTQASITIPIRLAYDVGETRYTATPIGDMWLSNGCATSFWRKQRMASNIQVYANGWFLDLAVSELGIGGEMLTTTNGAPCPQ